MVRGLSVSDQEIRADALNHKHVGRAGTIVIPDGYELSTTIMGIEWANSGTIGVFLEVP